MKVTTRGHRQAVLLRSTVENAVGSEEGDQIQIPIGERELDPRREDALARLRELRREHPAGFVFDRDDANVR